MSTDFFYFRDIFVTELVFVDECGCGVLGNEGIGFCVCFDDGLDFEAVGFCTHFNTDTEFVADVVKVWFDNVHGSESIIDSGIVNR
jgi:hypothetical protein